MAGKKHFKDVEKRLAAFGYVLDHVNAKGLWVYAHSDLGDLVVNTGLSEYAAQTLIQRLQQSKPSKPKRNAAAVKDRQQRSRDALKAEAERLAHDRAAIVAERDKRLSGLGATLTAAESRELSNRLEQNDRERHAIEKLMAAPVGGPNVGIRRARHEAGSSAPRKAAS